MGSLQRGPGLLAQDTSDRLLMNVFFETLQRGPGLLAQDTIVVRKIARQPQFASKRPRPFGPGYLSHSASLCWWTDRFKEAQAFWPRIPSSATLAHLASRCFKEAQAFWPRIPPGGGGEHRCTDGASKRPRPFGPGYAITSAQAVTLKQGFKEAQAFWPRIPGEKSYRIRRRDCFKEAQAFWPRILGLIKRFQPRDRTLQRGPGLLAQDTTSSARRATRS